MNNINEQLQLAVAVKEMIASHEDAHQEQSWKAIEEYTEIPKIIDWLLEKEADAKSMEKAIAERISDLQGRKKSYENRVGWYRNTLLWIMQQLDEETLRRAEATITRKYVSPKPIIQNEHLVPGDYKEVIYKIDKAKINNAVASGKTIPGIVIDNGGETILIRRK